MKWSAPTWWSWTKRAANGALCQVVFGRYMPMSSPVWVGIAQCAATSEGRGDRDAERDRRHLRRPAAAAPRRAGRSANPIPSPTTSAASSTQPGR